MRRVRLKSLQTGAVNAYGILIKNRNTLGYTIQTINED